MVLGAAACILNPQPLPPDNPDSGAPTSGFGREDGGKHGESDSGKVNNPPPPEDGGAQPETGGGSGGGETGAGGEEGGFEGGFEGGSDAAPEAGPGDGGKTVEGSAGDAGRG
jgi:hypothetical protein